MSSIVREDNSRGSNSNNNNNNSPVAPLQESNQQPSQLQNPHEDATTTMRGPAPSTTDDTAADIKDKDKGKYRYEVSALVLITFMLAACVLQRMATSNFYMRVLAFPLAVTLAFLGYEWTVYFSDGLTRRKRAHFDVKNILETYQPRRNTDEGRLFQPDPPTPNVSQPAPPEGTSSNDQQDGQQQNGEDQQTNFASWRKKHYENEYLFAMQSKGKESMFYEPPPQKEGSQPQEEATNGQQQAEEVTKMQEEANNQPQEEATNKPQEQEEATNQEQQD